jgi:hypothetical protein
MRSFLVLFLLVAPAAADPAKSITPDVRAMHTDDCAQARSKGKQCVIDMGKGEDVQGNGVSPNGTGVVAIPTTKQASLIHIRRDFIVEILKSAEDL